ncbi:dATP/dGTP diphosphohydrolase domain-containing protein, partial [Cutibacterium acnes]
PALIGAGGMKYDGGKARMALLFDGCPNALEAVGQVLTFGAQKYAAHSCQTVPEGEERYKSALLRHLLAVGKGEAIDPESNLHHLAHAACNALFILELELRKQNA